MLRALRLVLLGLVLSALIWWLMTLPGSMSLRYRDWQLEMRLPIAIVDAAIVLLLMLMMFRVGAILMGVPSDFRRRRNARRMRLGDEALLAGLAALAAEEPADARREARKARRLLEDAPRALWLAAEAARQAGAHAEADAASVLLSAGSKASAAREFLGRHGQALASLAAGDPEAARHHAAAAERLKHGAPGIVRLRMALERPAPAMAAEPTVGRDALPALAAPAAPLPPV